MIDDSHLEEVEKDRVYRTTENIHPDDWMNIPKGQIVYCSDKFEVIIDSIKEREKGGKMVENMFPMTIFIDSEEFTKGRGFEVDINRLQKNNRQWMIEESSVYDDEEGKDVKKYRLWRDTEPKERKDPYIRQQIDNAKLEGEIMKKSFVEAEPETK